jgi:hypothetical protein
MLIPLAIVGLTILLVAAIVWSIWGPPRESCGLRKNAGYRVVKSFASGKDEFREGEIVIFKRERRIRPWLSDEPMLGGDPDRPEQDLYDFVEVESNTSKTISSENFPTIKQWIQFLEEVHE